MSQKSIKRDAFREFRRRKQHVREHLRSPHPFLTVLIDWENKKILCAGLVTGTSSEKLAVIAAQQGCTNYDTQDVAVVI